MSTEQTPSVPPKPAALGVGAPPAGRTVPARMWVQNVETGQTRTVTDAELAELQSPWRQISITDAVRHHIRSLK